MHDSACCITLPVNEGEARRALYDSDAAKQVIYCIPINREAPWGSSETLDDRSSHEIQDQ